MAKKPRGESNAKQPKEKQPETQQTGDEEQPEKKPKKSRRIVRRVVGTVFLLLLALVIGAGAWFYARYGVWLRGEWDDAKRIVAESSENTFRQVETSLVYDINGNLISTLKGEKDVYYIGFQDIPSETIEAMISIEDKKFYRHNGLDMKAIVRAGWALVENKGEITQGASTITQQLARNIFLTHEETWERKIKEMFLAMELEKKYSKSKIMEFYLNNIYFANGYYGIQAASFGYFDRSVQELTLSEQAFLCAIPNSPNRYDPYQNMEGTIARRNRILEQMKQDGLLSPAEVEEAVRQEIVLCQKERKKSNYVETFAYDCAIRALMRREGFYFRYSFDSEEEEERYLDSYNQLYRQCQLSLYTGGYRIYTSIDPELQEELQAALDKALAGDSGQNEEGVYELQGAAVTVDNDNGRVAAIVGGRSQELAGYTLNRAYQSYRQPGSAIKPLIVYTPAFEKGYSPEDLVTDKKEEDGPRNVDEVYEGEISILRAVTVSKNTVAWNLFEELTPAGGLSYLLNMDFSRITGRDYVPAAALGGLTEGVSTLEMTAAFAALENMGVYREPTCIRSIMDAEGNVLVSEYAGEQHRVYGEEAVKKMNRCLLEVMATGTGRWGRLAEMPCAGKTGTTNVQRDKWFVGFTSYYTTGIWVGYDLPRSLENLPAETEPVRIWHNFMEPLHQGKEPVEIPCYVIPEPEEVPEEEPGEDPDEEDPEDGDVIEIPGPGEEDWPWGENSPFDDPDEGFDWEDWPEDEDWPGEDDSPDGELDEGDDPDGEEGPSGGSEPPDEPEPPGGEDPEELPEPPENPSIGPDELSPEDYWFFYEREP